MESSACKLLDELVAALAMIPKKCDDEGSAIAYLLLGHKLR